MDRTLVYPPVFLSDLRFQISLLRLIYPKTGSHPEESIYLAELERLQEQSDIVPAIKIAN
jgi:hypothetical protein